MRVLFSKPGKGVRLAHKERMILEFTSNDGKLFCDINGNPVPEEESFRPVSSMNQNYDDPWSSSSIGNQGIEEKLIPESVTDIVYEIDDDFGQFGYKNKAGEFVIEPQYAFAHEFTYGLAAVNLNRTWYRTEDGHRYYENHYGYINERGETVIPFAYDEAWPFNKYGVAVVGDRRRRYLIDSKGTIIPGTENLDIYSSYEYHSRFFEFNYLSDPDDGPVGLYDTKERRIMLEPSVDGFIEWNEDQILLYDRSSKMPGDFKQSYINSRGESLYPWLSGKGFSIVERPNRFLVARVANAVFTELPDDSCCPHFACGNKKYERKFLYGLYSPKGEFIVPPDYSAIVELTDTIFGCVKDETVTIVQLEESDYC